MFRRDNASDIIKYIRKIPVILLQGIHRVLIAWRINEIIRKRFYFVINRLEKDLLISIPKFEFSLNEKFWIALYYIRGNLALKYLNLLEKYIVEPVYKEINNSIISKDILFIFIVFRYINYFFIEYVDRKIDIDVDKMLEILEDIENNSNKVDLLVNMVYLSHFHSRVSLSELLVKASNHKLSRSIFNMILEHIRQVIMSRSTTTDYLLNVFSAIANREKTLKVLNTIERKIRHVVAKDINMERLLIIIENIKKKLVPPSKGRYLLMLLLRERGYNILYSYPELFTDKIPRRRTEKFKFMPKKKILKNRFFKLENELLGLTSDIHELPDIDGVARPIAYLVYPPRIIKIGDKEKLVRGRIGLFYLIETRYPIKTAKIWESFKKYVLSSRVENLPMIPIIIEIRDPYIKDDDSDDVLYNKKFYTYRTRKERDGKRRLLDYIRVEEVDEGEAIAIKRRFIFNLFKERDFRGAIISDKELKTYSQVLKELLKISDLITEIEISDITKKKLDEIENEIINELQRAFPEYNIERPLDLWWLYKDKEIREKASYILAHKIRELFPNTADKIAEDILLTSYIASVLGPYMEYEVFQKLLDESS